jgi:hypothetical protein
LGVSYVEGHHKLFAGVLSHCPVSLKDGDGGNEEGENELQCRLIFRLFRFLTVAVAGVLAAGAVAVTASDSEIGGILYILQDRADVSLFDGSYHNGADLEINFIRM